MRYPRLRYSNKEGGLIASDAVLMCFYMRQPHRRIAKALVHALDVLTARIQPQQFKWYMAPDGHTYLLDASRWEQIRESLSGPDEGSIQRLMSAQHVGSFVADYRGLPLPLASPIRKEDVSALFVTLPTEYLEERGAAHVRALALEMAEHLPFNSGYVDLVLCQADLLERGELAPVRSRHPSLHLISEEPDIQLGLRIEGVHWLNFLGQPVLGQLGGVAGLRERLAFPDPCIQEMSGERVLITLGEHPEVGDVEADQALPRHRTLARLLEPHLYHRPWRFRGMSPEELLRWERRFLDEPT